MANPFDEFDTPTAGNPFDAFDAPNKKASFLTAAKSALASASNAADSAISLPAGALASVFSQEKGDNVFRKLDERKAKNLQWANPDQEKFTVPQQVGAAVLTLPAQLLGMMGGPAEKGMDLLNRGESLNTARASTVIDAATTAAGVGPMAAAKSFLGRGAIGAAANMSMGAGSDSATQLLSSKQSTKDAYDPYDLLPAAALPSA